MKIHFFRSWAGVWATLFTAVALLAAAGPSSGLMPEKSYTGVVTAVNTNQQTFQVKHSFLPGKQFTYSKNCAVTLLYAMLNNGVDTAENVRPGEKVTVSYQNDHGVRLADRIEQQPMQLTGTVKEINPEQHLLIVHERMSHKRLTIASNCMIALHDHAPGTLTDIHPGDQVEVLYELPDGVPMAWQITK
jgi:hypothetical protein